MSEPRMPRRFRRRLLAVMMTLGLLPVLGFAVASHRLTTELLAIRPAQLDPLLGRLDERLGTGPQDAALREEVAAMRVNLVQAELARRSLGRLMPSLLAMVVVVSTLVVGLTATLLGRQLTRPIELLAAGMSRYARGDLSHRIAGKPARRPDELQFLMRQFDAMGDELATQRARLEVSEGLAAWQGVARALAHELKNPLTAMRLAVGRLRRREATEAEPHVESLSLIEGQIDVLLRLAQSFSTFAKLPAPRPRSIELARLLDDVCALYAHASPVPVECRVPRGLPLEADPELLGRALGNLVKNALEASQAGGEPVRVTACEAEGGWLQIEVSDGGCGVGRVLEGTALAQSLGSTKAEGSGLGLPIAHRIVHEHGGALRLEPRQDGGTRAVVRLPARTGG